MGACSVINTKTGPPDTAMNRDGTPFTGQLSISEVPLALAPVALPEFITPGLLITVQPVGVSFTTPVPITYPNIDNLPPGAEVDLYQVDRDSGTFVVSGRGRVDTDGSHIETISGGITQTTWHCQHPSSGEEDEGGADSNDEDNPCGGCPSEPTNSSFSLNDGRMSTSFSLPASCR
jgi:hypothetical protein